MPSLRPLAAAPLLGEGRRLDLGLGVKRLTINSIRFGPLYVVELELVELDPKDDLVEVEPESELVKEIEIEEGLLGLTSLCPAVEEELSGELPSKVRVSSAANTVARVNTTIA